MCIFRVEQVDESNICQQAAANVFQVGDADQGPERTT